MMKMGGKVIFFFLHTKKLDLFLFSFYKCTQPYMLIKFLFVTLKHRDCIKISRALVCSNTTH